MESTRNQAWKCLTVTLLLSVVESDTHSSMPNYAPLLTRYRSRSLNRMKGKPEINRTTDPIFSEGVCLLNYTYKDTTVLFFYWHIWKVGGSTNKAYFKEFVSQGLADYTYCGHNRAIYRPRPPWPIKVPLISQAPIIRWIFDEASLGISDNAVQYKGRIMDDNQTKALYLHREGQTYICYFFSFIRNPVAKFMSAFWEAHFRESKKTYSGCF